MTTANKRNKPMSNKLTRSETVTVRLDPKISYLCELASRTQRRTRSSFIEWAVEHALREVKLIRHNPKSGLIENNLADLANVLWNVEEWERVARLATSAPELLSIEEQKWWAIACDEPWMWILPDGPRILDNIDRKVFRRNWDGVKSVAEGRMTDLELNSSAMQSA